MTTFRVIEAKPQHCGRMVRKLRAEHHAAIAGIGVSAHHELRARFDDSSFRRAWLIDGRLAALGGVTGSALQTSGQIWLALSQEAMRHPLQVVKEARRQLAEIMRHRHELVTVVLGGDDAAQRFAIFLGFEPIDRSVLILRAYTRAGRRFAARFLDAPENRIVMGNGYGIGLRYQQEAELPVDRGG